MKLNRAIKYTSIFLAGAIFATAGSAFADTSYSTVKVLVLETWKINVNGKPLDTTPISYNNITYIPLRKATEAVGGNVSLNGNTIDIVTEPKNKDEVGTTPPGSESNSNHPDSGFIDAPPVDVVLGG